MDNSPDKASEPSAQNRDQTEPSLPWVHVGECPVCVNGLCRVRRCTDECSGAHFYALCDECEATWVEPDTSTIRSFPTATAPLCPICRLPMYGSQAGWAKPTDFEKGNVWAANAIFDVPSRGQDEVTRNKFPRTPDEDREPHPGC